MAITRRLHGLEDHNHRRGARPVPAHRLEQRQRRRTTAAGPASWRRANSTPRTWRRWPPPRHEADRCCSPRTPRAPRRWSRCAAAAAKTLVAGDFFLLTYSRPRRPGARRVGRERRDKLDETWCLYDGQLIDDELYQELGRVRRRACASWCCRTAATAAPWCVPARRHRRLRASVRSKMMPPSVAMRTYEAHKAFYDKLQTDVAKANAGGRGRPRRGAGRVAVSTRLTTIGKRFKARGDPDLRLPGQPDLDGRRPQRRLHRTAADGVEPRQFQRQLRQLPRAASRPACRPSSRRTCLRWDRWSPS